MRYLLVILAAGTLVASAAASTTVTARERKAIDATLDRFIPSAVGRRHTAASYDLATPALQEGMTKREWAKGDIPVYPFPVRGRVFHGWEVDEVDPGYISVDILLQPQWRYRKKLGAIAFTVGMKEIRGRWLVDSMLPTAIFSPNGQPAGVTANRDFSGSAPTSKESTGNSVIGHDWAYALLGGLGSLIVLVPLTLWAVATIRNRRAYRAYEAARAARTG